MCATFLGSIVGAAVLYIIIPKPDGKFRILVMAAKSMEPTIMTGNCILVDTTVNVEEIVAAPYPTGDIIAFHQSYGDAIIAHRAVEKQVDAQGNVFSFTTKGDHNVGADQPIPASSYIGKVVNTNLPFYQMLTSLISLIAIAIATGILTVVLYIMYHKEAKQKIPVTSARVYREEAPKDRTVPQEEMTEDPIKILRMRLAKGEISKEEYEELKKRMKD